MSGSDDEDRLDIDTWDEIRSAFLVGLISMMILLTIYEVFRRIPRFAILYDKRRLYAPERTPTRLMKSRSLSSNVKCCKLPALFEFLFFTFDDSYIRYAMAVNGDNDSKIVTNLFGYEEGNNQDKTDSKPVYPSRWNGQFLKGSIPIIRYFFLLVSNKFSRSSKGKDNEKEKTTDEEENSDQKEDAMSMRASFRMDEFTTLSSEDKKLLQCVGVDSYCMIRFLRFGFEITSFFFILSLIILVPLYYLNEEPSAILRVGNTEVQVAVKGYFQITINHLDNGSKKLWVPWAFGICFYIYLLERFYLEWIVFHQARLDFLADGDYFSQKGDDLESLHQYRNSCLVENIPPEYRTDEALRNFLEVSHSTSRCPFHSYIHK